MESGDQTQISQTLANPGAMAAFGISSDQAISGQDPNGSAKREINLAASLQRSKDLLNSGSTVSFAVRKKNPLHLSGSVKRYDQTEDMEKVEQQHTSA